MVNAARHYVLNAIYGQFVMVQMRRFGLLDPLCLGWHVIGSEDVIGFPIAVICLSTFLLRRFCF